MHLFKKKKIITYVPPPLKPDKNKSEPNHVEFQINLTIVQSYKSIRKKGEKER